jgi:hypothetical protein
MLVLLVGLVEGDGVVGPGPAVAVGVVVVGVVVVGVVVVGVVVVGAVEQRWGRGRRLRAIDCRKNGGGSSEMVAAACSLW